MPSTFPRFDTLPFSHYNYHICVEGWQNYPHLLGSEANKHHLPTYILGGAAI